MQEKEYLILNVVEVSAYEKCLNVLNSNFTSSVLQQMVSTLRFWLSSKKAVHVGKDGGMTSCLPVSTYFIMKSHTKDSALEFLAVFLADVHNCSLMIDSFPEIIRELLRKCTDEFFVSVDEVSKYKDDNRVFSKSERWGNGSYELVSPWFVLTKQIDSDYKRNTFVHIDKALFPYFYRAFHRDSKMGVVDLPKEENLKILLTENAVISVFPLVQSLYEQGELEVNSRGKLSVSTVRRCAQQLGDFEEFFPESKESVLKNFRTFLFFYYLHYRLNSAHLKTVKKDIGVESILKDVPNVLLPSCKLLFGEILPHLTGSSSMMDLTNAHYLFLDILDVLSKSVKSQDLEWVSVDAVLDGVLSKDHGYAHSLLFSPYDFFYDKLKFKNSKMDKRFVALSRFREEIMVPYAKSLFLMMSSAGLFDIAYREYQQDDCSWVDWLKYVRMTNLGKYVLGLSNEYHPMVHFDQIRYFEIDSERLIVRSLVEKNPFCTFLEDIAKPIGNQRYILSMESLVRNCTTKRDVESKIDFFRRHISSELSPVWEDFFDDALERCNPFTTLRPIEYSMFQIKPENKSLIHLLGTDSVLKKMVIRAEGFVFIVRNTDKKAFVERMKFWGYIL